MKERLLTKSRFKLASECAAKLYYTGKKSEYPDAKLDSPFLEALARGGFQVGELAKLYFPGGVEVVTLDYTEALSQTNALLAQDEVVIHEGAFRYGDLFVRADVVRKRGRTIELFEVKSKGFHPGEESFTTSRGSIGSGWRPYLEDVAFQAYVIANALPGTTVVPHLMLANKSKVATVDGLNQRFLVRKVDGRAKAYTRPGTTPVDICRDVLIAVPVESEVDYILAGYPDSKTVKPTEEKLADRAARFAAAYKEDRRIQGDLTSAPCRGCEFRAKPADLEAGLKCGLRECYSARLPGLGGAIAEDAPTIDLWRLHYMRRERLLAEGKFLMRDLTEEDVDVKSDDKAGLSSSQRQWLQVRSATSGESFVDAPGLIAAMDTWQFPLHFIDFETAMAALPFHKGRHPFEQIAFQFSHHILHADGRLEHANQFLLAEPGAFPNYEFVRELKKALGDAGTILRYSNHENTVLCQIYDQLADDDSVTDREELMSFIKSITTSRDKERGLWDSPRTMVDMCGLWIRHAYLPATGGSNSIKKVLPAILAKDSPSLLRFRSPTYGAAGGMKSLNFRDWTWLTVSEGKVGDPYKLLPPVFEGLKPEDLAQVDLLADAELADGGAAMVAYGLLQFTEMSDLERQRVKQALLKYCELDTLAMAMLYFYFEDVTAAAMGRGRSA